MKQLCKDQSAFKTYTAPCIIPFNWFQFTYSQKSIANFIFICNDVKKNIHLEFEYIYLFAQSLINCLIGAIYPQYVHNMLSYPNSTVLW